MNDPFDGARPRIGISACLLGQRVRYDGDHKRQDWLVDELGPHVTWVPVCPEVELGLGVPREAIQLVPTGGAGELRQLGARSNRDLTGAMRSYAADRVEQLIAEGLSGYVLKTRSPSCGLTEVKVFARAGDEEPLSRDGRGLFAAAVVERLPGLPVVEEHVLGDAAVRDDFVARVRAASSAVFRATSEPISAEVFATMKGTSWREHPECPDPAALALIRMNHWGFDGKTHGGELVVAASVADEVMAIFERLFAARFPIGQMARVDMFGGDDDASMAANNCSAFNFRLIAGTSQLSNHARGLAIDINPVQNPWMRGGRVLPPAGTEFVDRTRVRPGMIVRPGPVTDAFDAFGWDWGGDWDGTKDYHHFARLARS